jgi:hypothetical protein
LIEQISRPLVLRKGFDEVGGLYSGSIARRLNDVGNPLELPLVPLLKVLSERRANPRKKSKR